MNELEAMKTLNKSIDNASIFSNKVDVFALAQELGFSIGKADMARGDGFIAVDEEQRMPGFGTKKIIAVNDENDMKSKLRFIAQALVLYAFMKEKKPNETVKFALRNPLIITDAVITDCEKLLVHKPKTPKQQKPTRREYLAGALEELLDEALCQMDSIGVRPLQDWGAGTRSAKYTVSPQELSEAKMVVAHTRGALASTELMTPEQIKRDQYITSLLSTYVDMSKEREENKTKFRKRLFYGCGIASIVIIGMCLFLLGSWVPIIFRQYENRDTAVRDKIYAYIDAAAGDTDDGGTGADGTGDEQAAAQQGAAADGGTEQTGATNGTGTEQTGATNGTGTTGNGDSEDGDTEVSAIIAGLKGLLKGTEFEPLLEPFIQTLLEDGTTEAVTDISVRNVVSLITICLTMLGSIFVLLKIIANNVFPQQEENRIQTLVQSIQKSDYDHRIALIKAKTGEAIGCPPPPEPEQEPGKK